MYYEINVAKNGFHFFATSERSITTVSQLCEVYTELARAFPKSAGYEITVTETRPYRLGRWESVGHHINPSDFIVKPTREEYANRLARATGADPEDAYIFLFGGPEMSQQAIDLFESSGYDDDAESYNGNSEFWEGVGFSEADVEWVVTEVTEGHDD